MKKSDKYFMDYDIVLLKASIYCIFFLFLSQCFLFYDQTRNYLSQVDKIEGERIVLEAPLAGKDTPIVITATHPQREEDKTGIFTIYMQDFASQQVFVMINGQKTGNFKTGELRITASEGDLIQIDATQVKETIQYTVDLSKTKVRFTEDHTFFASEGNIISLGKVKF